MFELLPVSAAALLAGFTQGLAGFGSVIVALPVFTALMGIKTAVPLANLFAMGISLYLCFRFRSIQQWPRFRPLIIAALPGIFLGTWILEIVPGRFLEISLAATITIYCLYSFFGKEHSSIFGAPWAYVAGFTSGLLGGSIGAYGPPIVIYISLQPWEVEIAKSVMSGFFFLASLGVAISHVAGGLIDAKVLSLAAAPIPSVTLGIMLGSACEGWLNEQMYRKVILVLLQLLALLLFFKAA
jgi:uncharacterized protein